MKNSIIMEVTNDEYEFCVNLFDSTEEVAEYLNISKNYAKWIICNPPKCKKTKFVRVWLNRKYL